MKRLLFFTAVSFIFSTVAFNQAPDKPTSVELHNKLKKLNFLGSALYFAAHPDDENTRLISYLSNHYKARTGYLSLTRGDGGQNLIGSQIREQLGVIRTQELLAARSIDGGEQFFTRANDFGFSKHPDETLAIWNKEAIMQDVVKVIRQFQPDIIINRFDHRSPGRTHGHHTSSAMLSVESFDKAADASFDTEIFSELNPWQTQRIFFNTSWWFYGSREKFNDADKSKMISVDAGVYYPGLGISNSEIAASSRSMHKSQGFGSTGTRGSQTEYLELVQGEMPDDRENLFDGINTSWSRISGGAPIGAMVSKVIENYNFSDPSVHIDALLSIRDKINALEDSHWKLIKQQEVDELIIQSAGLYIEAKSDRPLALQGEQIEVSIEAINRAEVNVELKSIMLNNDTYDLSDTLNFNESNRYDYNYTIDTDQIYSNPYWLNELGTLGMYKVSDFDQIGTPENRPPIVTFFELLINGRSFNIQRSLIYKSNDPVKGEVYEPFVIMPKASIAFTDPIYIFPDRESKEISTNIVSNMDTLSGKLVINAPKTWSITPDEIDINLYGKGSTAQFSFSVKGPYLQESERIALQLKLENGEVVNKTISEIEFDHIPKQYVISSAQSKVERISIKKEGDNIAYIMGAGDKIPESLRQIGYTVDLLQVEELTDKNLADYDALIMGVRAYNTKPELNLKKQVINDYMVQGGTVIVQYNTNRGGVKGNIIAPYPMELSRDRVTDENAAISIVDPSHEVLNYPNKISTRDFDNWVQERGLYFPNKWSDEYQTPLACSDSGEPLSKGALLIAPVGKGHFIYSGLSWFRQLPAGVPGAYRLFTNLISIGKNPDSQNNMSNGSNR